MPFCIFCARGTHVAIGTGGYQVPMKEDVGGPVENVAGDEKGQAITSVPF
ncbi:MAG: hypothetical protein WCB68_14490 [Pyrinomonadaceae bacterium]